MSEENLEELYLDNHRDLTEEIKNIAEDLHSDDAERQEEGKQRYKALFFNERFNEHNNLDDDEMNPFYRISKRYLDPHEISSLLAEFITNSDGGGSKARRSKARRSKAHRSKAHRSKAHRSKAHRSKARKSKVHRSKARKSKAHRSKARKRKTFKKK
jgi:hypothetical protein